VIEPIIIEVIDDIDMCCSCCTKLLQEFIYWFCTELNDLRDSPGHASRFRDIGAIAPVRQFTQY